MTQTIKAIIFDMGGVFINTFDHSARQNMAQRYGITEKELDRIVFHNSLSADAEKGLYSKEELLERMAQQVGIPLEDATAFYMEYFSKDEEDAELVAFVRTLKPHYKLGLLSNAYPGTREWMQEYHTFLDLFEISFFSAEAGMRKPEPEFFRLILDAMQVEPQKTLFVDDFPENIAGAQQLGMQTVWYTDREKCIPLLKDLLQVSG